jgi:hypothetical protein
MHLSPNFIDRIENLNNLKINLLHDINNSDILKMCLEDPATPEKTRKNAEIYDVDIVDDEMMCWLTDGNDTWYIQFNFVRE